MNEVDAQKAELAKPVKRYTGLLVGADAVWLRLDAAEVELCGYALDMAEAEAYKAARDAGRREEPTEIVAAAWCDYAEIHELAGRLHDGATELADAEEEKAEPVKAEGWPY